MERLWASSTLSEMWVVTFGVIVVLMTGCVTPTESVTVSTPSPTPAVLSLLKTRNVPADGFVITVPDDFKDQPWQGIDSSGWSFKGKTMTISTESGMYAPDAKNYGYLNFRESQKTIDGENAQIAMYEMPDQKGLIEPKKRHCVKAYFGGSNKRRSELGVYAHFEDPKDEQLALQIIESIRFQQSQ